MSVLMADVQTKLWTDHGIRLPSETTSELLYADDTLLVGTNAQTVEKQLACIVELGAQYGLEMNWAKVDLMTARCDLDLKTRRGKSYAKRIR